MKAARAVAISLILIPAWGCAHGVQETTALGVVVQSIPAGEAAGAVSVTVRNASDEARCIYADLLANPDSNYVLVRLRRDGRSIGPPDGGFLLPPKRAGLAQVPPGSEVSFVLHLFGHFNPSQVIEQEDLETRVGIGNFPCSNPTGGQEQVSWSEWTEFRWKGSPERGK